MRFQITLVATLSWFVKILFLLAVSELDAAPSEARNTCNATLVGFGPDGESGALSAAQALDQCGVALVKGALTVEPLESILGAFRALPPEQAENLRHGRVRERRLQTHLPDVGPFSSLELLGKDNVLEQPLRAALGDDFVLDLVTIVEVPPGAQAQEPHRDTPAEGSVAVHIPLHALTESMAPLGMCAGTHVLPAEAASANLREAILWRNKGETSLTAKQRLYCGGRQRTTSFNVSLSPNRVNSLRVRDSRLGAEIVRFIEPEMEALPWQLHDEITHVGDTKITGSDDWQEFASSASGSSLNVRVERLVPDGLPNPPPLLVVAAPLAVGDAVLYDSRIFHWGMAHTMAEGTAGAQPRYVLYANFKSSTDHLGVHPDSSDTADTVRKARAFFQARLQTLKRREL